MRVNFLFFLPFEMTTFLLASLHRSYILKQKKMKKNKKNRGTFACLQATEHDSYADYECVCVPQNVLNVKFFFARKTENVIFGLSATSPSYLLRLTFGAAPNY